MSSYQYAKRTYRWLFPALPDANVHGFSLEFAAREMAEIDLVGKWDRERILSAGPADRLFIPNDPGFHTHWHDLFEKSCFLFR